MRAMHSQAREVAASYDEVTRRVRALGAEEYGRSVEDEPLWFVTAGAREAPETVLVVAGLHAMEHVGTLAALALAERVAKGAAGAAWKRRRLVVAPLANPDGFRAVLRARAEGSRRFLRANAHGVDLNRNFAAHWNDRHWLTRLLPRVYAAGAAPLSEPESAALDRLAAEERPAIVVSLHAFGDWLYLPWAGSRDAPADAEAMLALARTATSRQERPYKIAQLARRSRLFTAHGAEIDHFLERFGAWTFLFEIGAGPRASDPGSWFDPYRWYTPRADLLARDVDNLLPALDALAEAELPFRLAPT
jgi:predicted deacylase